MALSINGLRVTNGEVTTAQRQLWKQNRNTPVDERSYSPLNPAQKFYLCLAAEGFKLNEAKERARQLGINDDDLTTAQEALALQVNDDDQVTAVTRPAFMGADFVTDPEIKNLLEAAVAKSPDCLHMAVLDGANLKEAQLRGVNLQRAGLRGVDLQGADLRGANLCADLEKVVLIGANLRGATLRKSIFCDNRLQRADLSLTDVSEVYLPHVGNLNSANFLSPENLDSITWNLAFYYAANQPENLLDLSSVPDDIKDTLYDIKDKLLALDKPSYEEAKKLQNAYREALVSNNEATITAAEKALTEHLGKCREENAKKAIQQAAPVLGAEAISILVEKLAGSAVTATDSLPNTAASPSDQQDLSLDGGNIDPYSQYGYPALQR
jgi:uncharacterized protein YjbI with pentapeptide repeats